MKKHSLGGLWELAIIDQISSNNYRFRYSISLPATLASVGSLPVKPEIAEGRLTQTRPFIGKAIFRKECFLEQAEAAVLTLERT